MVRRSFFMLSMVMVVLGSAPVLANGLPVVRGNAHDFDFEFGAWNATLRVRAPLSHADRWTDFTGTSTVTPFWDGRANYGILSVSHGATRLRGLTLRLFQPDTRQWYLRFANSSDGKLGVAAIGGFSDGRGVFYDTEPFAGKMVSVRFVFSEITRTSFRFAQSYSADGGATWIVNWDSTFTRRA